MRDSVSSNLQESPMAADAGKLRIDAGFSPLLQAVAMGDSVSSHLQTENSYTRLRGADYEILICNGMLLLHVSSVLWSQKKRRCRLTVGFLPGAVDVEARSIMVINGKTSRDI